LRTSGHIEKNYLRPQKRVVRYSNPVEADRTNQPERDQGERQQGQTSAHLLGVE